MPTIPLFQGGGARGGGGLEGFSAVVMGLKFNCHYGYIYIYI